MGQVAVMFNNARMAIRQPRVIDVSFYSDVFKSLYGFRPSMERMERFRNLTPVEQASEMEVLSNEALREDEFSKKREQDAFQTFNDLIDNLAKEYNITRATAIRWLFVADVEPDDNGKRTRQDFEMWLFFTHNVHTSENAQTIWETYQNVG